MKIKTLRAFRLGKETFKRGAEATVSGTAAADLERRGFAELIAEPKASKAEKADPLDHDQDGRKGGTKATKAAAKRDEAKAE